MFVRPGSFPFGECFTGHPSAPSVGSFVGVEVVCEFGVRVGPRLPREGALNGEGLPRLPLAPSLSASSFSPRACRSRGVSSSCSLIESCGVFERSASRADRRESFKTSNGGSLGSCIDEERSKLRYLVRIAEFSESSSLRTQMAPPGSFPRARLSERSVLQARDSSRVVDVRPSSRASSEVSGRTSRLRASRCGEGRSRAPFRSGENVDAGVSS